MNHIENIYDFAPQEEDFLEAVSNGLSGEPKALPCKFLYDERGSKLFDEICELDEYYPTRTEERILRSNRGEIAGLIGEGAELIEFGCGSLNKVRILLDAMDKPARFIPIDISREHLLSSAEDLAKDFPDLSIVPVCADYTEPLALPNDVASKKVGFFPGSTIGNFNPADAVDFLGAIAGIVGKGGDMLIGVDLKKDEQVLNAAYNDAQGVTAEFNLNLLRRINDELGGDFELSAFEHEAFYSEDEGRVEMHLRSTRDQDVTIANDTYRFEKDETIHTENSYKYALEEFHDTAAKAGYAPVRSWIDDGGLFSVHYLTVS